MQDTFGALVPGIALDIAGAADGLLHDAAFVAKDVFDIAGLSTGAGNPTRRATFPAAARTAAAVVKLLEAGAHLVGKTRTDELAYGLSGENELDGTPINPAAQGMLPGGSSSGSAAAVAGGLADIGLGTDTGGSIRVPASHCGLFGVRPTHGRVTTEGVVALAPSFDTVGWLTRDAATLVRVARVLLDHCTPAPPPRRLVVLDDFAVDVGFVDALAASIGADVEYASLGDLDRWREAFRILQAREAWAAHGEWIRTASPVMGVAVAQRFAAAAAITDTQVNDARAARDELRTRVEPWLAGNGALVVPAAGAPLPIGADAASVDASRTATLRITVLASLLGAPAIAVPLGTSPPRGVSLVAAPGADEMLLAAAAAHEA